MFRDIFLRLFTHLKQDDHGNRPTHCVGGDRDSSGFAAKKRYFWLLGPIFQSGFAAAALGWQNEGDANRNGKQNDEMSPITE